MAQPNVKLYINTGTEETPVWTEVDDSEELFFTGSKTTSGVIDKVMAPKSLTKFPEQLWKGDSETYGNGIKCTTYEQDITVATNTNILAFQFDDNPTSTAPILTAWDDTNYNSTDYELLSGTTNYPDCLLRGHITASDVLPSASIGSLNGNWKTQSITTDTYKLEGDTHKQIANSSISTGNQLRFIISCYIPFDIAEGTNGHNPIIACKYTYV